jgi:hypothetical protein
MQQPSVSLKAGTKMSPDIAFREQALQVVQNHKRTSFAQVLQQEVDALFRRDSALRLSGWHS